MKYKNKITNKHKAIYRENWWKQKLFLKDENLMNTHLYWWKKKHPTKCQFQGETVPMDILRAFFTEVELITLKFVWKDRRPPDSQNNLEKEEQSWKHHTSLTSDDTAKLQQSNQNGIGTHQTWSVEQNR